MNRYNVLDEIRGLTLVSMIIYHSVWDLVYLYDVELPWLTESFDAVWQQSICITFILLSGFCFSLGKRKLYRGLITSGAGVLVTIVTAIFMPEYKIMFGILTCLGTCTLMMIPLDRLFQKVSPYIGIVIAFLLFLITKNINDGYIGFRGLWSYNLPEAWYDLGNIATFFGLTDIHFSSGDYFSIMPWIFLFITGYFLFGIVNEHLDKLKNGFSLFSVWGVVGRNSLLIYLLHQPVVYGVLELIY